MPYVLQVMVQFLASIGFTVRCYRVCKNIIVLKMFLIVLRVIIWASELSSKWIMFHGSSIRKQLRIKNFCYICYIILQLEVLQRLIKGHENYSLKVLTHLLRKPSQFTITTSLLSIFCVLSIIGLLHFRYCYQLYLSHRLCS